MQAASISFVERSVILIGVVTHVIHTVRDNRGISAIFQLKTVEQKVVVVAEFGTINNVPVVGEIWRTIGEHKSDQTYVSQFKAEETTKLHPEIKTPSEVLVDFLVYNTIFIGINRHWAKKLVRVFNTDLFDILNSFSALELAQNTELKMSKTMASKLLEGWKQVAKQSALNDLFQDKNLPEELIETTRQLLGDNADELVKKNPYLIYPIISVKAPKRNWKKLDATIRKQFNIKKNDHRRAVSFIESVLYSANSKQGHMSLPLDAINRALKEASIKFDLHTLNHSGVEHRTLCFNEGTQTVQVLGHQAIEKTINSLLGKRIIEIDDYIDIGSYDIEATLCKLASMDVIFNLEQRRAFENAITKPLSVIEGSSKTGKTAVVQAVVDALMENGKNVWLITPLSNNEAGGLFGLGHEPIHSFISKSKSRNKRDLLNNSVVIVDEAQSIDVLKLYKLLKCLPLNTKICFVGDNRKLPPLGPGNMFQQLVSTDSKLITKLKQSYYDEFNSGLSNLTLSISNPNVHFDITSIPKEEFIKTESISIYETSETSHESLTNITSNTWLELNQNFNKKYQVICANALLCDSINKHIQQVRFFRKKIPKISVGDKIFYEDDPVVFIKKNPYLEISSGEIAVIYEVFHEPIILQGRECLLSILINGKVIEMSEEDIMCLSISYAITAYKIQCHKFPNTIILLDNSYLINKAWLYTATTATIESMILIGDRYVLERKINSTKFSSKRFFGIPIKLAT